jgi:hypothetical protein
VRYVPVDATPWTGAKTSEMEELFFPASLNTPQGRRSYKVCRELDNFSSFSGFMKVGAYVKALGKNKLNIWHYLFGSPSADPKTKGPQNRTTILAAFCFRISPNIAQIGAPYLLIYFSRVPKFSKWREER